MIDASDRPRIAIVGMSGLFAGSATLDEFWANVEAGTDCSRDVPPDRWLIDPREAYSPEIARIDHVYSKRGYFLSEIPVESDGLAISANELVEFDPSVRLAVILAARAWKSARARSLDRRRVGVILGHIALPTEFASRKAREILEPLFRGETLPLSVDSSSNPFRVASWPAIIAAKAIGLGGGAFTLDAACASSLYAIQLACQELQEGRADAMLAGGLSRPDCLYTQMGFAQLRALASHRCSPFDAAGDGLMVGEGGGIFVLKRVTDAVRDGDTIHGVIAGIGLSNDRAGNLLAPASEGQLRAMRPAYRDAGWSPDDVDLIECHATGTPVGDATEVRSLQELWHDRGRTGQCVIGSVKSTVGHLLTGASAAGLMKVLLAMRHRRFPPTANFRNAARDVQLTTSKFRVLDQSEDWPTNTTRPRRAAVSGFGFGGINAHLLVEEWQEAAENHVSGMGHRNDKPCQVAIVGLAVRAGSLTSAKEFKDRFFPAPDSRFPIPGAIEHIDVPLGRFAIPPREFESMLPQQVLALLAAASALQDAGLSELPEPESTGVYLGLVLDPNTTNFHFRWSQNESDRDTIAPLTADRTMGALASIAASRVARAFGAGGPSFALSSEETSGARALELAVKALQRGEISLALAGAVELTNDVRIRAMLPAELRPIDACVTLVLERLEDAQRNGRTIHAVIEGDEGLDSGFTAASHGSIAQPKKLPDSQSFGVEREIGYAGAAGPLLAVAAACLVPQPASVYCTGLDGNQFSFALSKPSSARNEPMLEPAQGPSLRVPVRQIPFELRPSQPLSAAHAVALPESELFPAAARAQLAVVEAHAEFLRFTAATQARVAALLQGHEVEVTRSIAFDREMCLAFARGRIAPVLGERYAEIDQFPTRVRLPDEPLMLVDRILTVEAEPLSLTHGRLVTEHDVTPGRWYLDHDRIPVCIAVEAGQADLFLCSFLGIDLHARGQAVYRLLDAVVTFHRDLPAPTSVIRYDIHIDRFFRQGETHLFRFRFVGTVDGEPLLTMTDGCAGFFTEEELAAGKGIVHTELDRRPIQGKLPADWRPLVPLEEIETFDDGQLEALRQGDLAACYGSRFAGLHLQNPLRLPGGQMHLVDRITSLEPKGGRFGLGLIRGEADIHPDDWFLTCHFVDDMVMPGTLMFECCLHTLRVLLMRMGWVGEHDEVAWQPVPGVPARLRCRGQVIASTRKVTYEVSVKEFGYRPEPYAIADVLMYADGKPIVEMLDMSVRLTGTDREKLERLWASQTHHTQPSRTLSHPQRAPVYDTDKILAFAIGKPSKAFGDRYRVFDHERVIARLPGPPYSFLDRIVEVGGPPWVMQAGASAVAEYDVPPDAWYFEANGRPIMPFGVLLEIALQPCGWLAAYVGSALHSETDVSFRNLGGKATQYQQIRPNIGRLTTRVKLTNVATSGGMIIQHYSLAVADVAGQPVYDGTTYFGFFSKAALSQQIGLRDVPPLESFAASEHFECPTSGLFPSSQLRMIDRIATDGHDLFEGRQQVNPDAWYFKAHFYQDPVVPGSLGLEAFLQLLNVVAERRWGSPKIGGWQSPALGSPHEWEYRGQILPTNGQVTVRANVTKIDDHHRMVSANGVLYVDGRPIYRMTDFSLQGWD